MRTVTVEELEALRDETYALWEKLDNFPDVADYDANTYLEEATDKINEASAILGRAYRSLSLRLASARADAEADKADAERKDV